MGCQPHDPAFANLTNEEILIPVLPAIRGEGDELPVRGEGRVALDARQARQGPDLHRGILATLLPIPPSIEDQQP